MFLDRGQICNVTRPRPSRNITAKTCSPNVCADNCQTCKWRLRGENTLTNNHTAKRNIRIDPPTLIPFTIQKQQARANYGEHIFTSLSGCNSPANNACTASAYGYLRRLRECRSHERLWILPRAFRSDRFAGQPDKPKSPVEGPVNATRRVGSNIGFVKVSF